ncbi:MAG: hypothetical protein LBQ58_09175, partial [Synergistaceae bacterium]|nr:hypothetical protein [Synergistaceae bacterium]
MKKALVVVAVLVLIIAGLQMTSRDAGNPTTQVNSTESAPTSPDASAEPDSASTSEESPAEPERTVAVAEPSDEPSAPDEQESAVTRDKLPAEPEGAAPEAAPASETAEASAS